jgi:methyl-accepting chemotaxis protein
MVTSDPATKWLKRLVLLGALLLLCLLCALVVQLTLLMHRLEDTAVGVAAGANQVATAAANIAQRIDQLDGFAERLIDILPGASDAANPLSGTPTTKEAQEISYLLTRIGEPALRYEYGNDKRDATWVRTKLALKYELFRDSVKSAEDFIDKVATRTHEGDLYYVIDAPGQKNELGPWLREILQEYRAKASPGP